MISRCYGWTGWVIVVILFGALTVGIAVDASAQDGKRLIIQKSQKPVPSLEIREIPSPPELTNRKRTPKRAVTPVEKKPLEPGAEFYQVRVDGTGMLFRIDEELNEILVEESLLPLAADVTYIIGEDQYSTPPASMIGAEIAYRRHTETGLVTEVRLYEDVRDLVETDE